MLPRNHPDRIQIAFDDHRCQGGTGWGEIGPSHWPVFCCSH